MDDYVFIDTINIAKFEGEEFDPNAEENEHVKEDLHMTFDGKILAVKRDRIEPLAKRKDIFLVRMKMRPPPEKLEIKTEDDFFEALAYLVDPEDL